ncbi:hypothetical protein HID58_085217 [Brassica napus]|uniref:Uncharacterized protein n=1 Tax=Brassica napus TaxID=3708 RepID=A0ABQ7XM51_BRANA|nr:hypothetical protein HID58_085217 [Brassica napus]
MNEEHEEGSSGQPMDTDRPSASSGNSKKGDGFDEIVWASSFALAFANIPNPAFTNVPVPPNPNQERSDDAVRD